MEVEHRYYIIKWSSIWIFLPFLIWLFKKNKAPLYSAIFLPITGISSMLHWSSNHKGDPRHLFDIFSSTTLIILLSIRLIQTNVHLCLFLLTGICLLFVIQRYLQINRTVSWDLITCIHLLFHYLIFLLAMFVHLPNIKWILFITVCILIHMIWLYSSYKM